MSNQEWVMIPVEPTPEMVEAAEDEYMPFGDMEMAIRMAVLAAPQPAEQAVEQSVIAGALFDFLGFLTSRDSNTTFGATSLATPAVDLLSEWAETRSLALDDADVINWQSRISAAPPAPDVTSLDAEQYTAADMASQAAQGFRDGRDSVAGLVEALEQIRAIDDELYGGDWDEIEKARNIANEALAAHRKQKGVQP